MTYFDVLSMPLVTFWSYNRQVDRLRAEKEQRQLRVILAGSSESAEAAKRLAETLTREVGTTVIVEKGFDEEKFAELQRKLSGVRVSPDTHME